MNAFRGGLGIRVIQWRPADPEAKGLVERAVISMKGDSYRLKDRDLGRVPGSRQNQRLKINQT